MANSYQYILADNGDKVVVKSHDLSDEKEARFAISVEVGREQVSLHLNTEQLASLQAQIADL